VENSILIVDDEPSIVMSLEYLMRKQGYRVLIARNGMEALDLLKKEKINLVLLDIMMPDVDGYEICNWIKTQEHLASTKLIFLSAKSKRSDIEKGLELGADAYVTKPFSTRKLTKQIEELIKIDN